MNAIDVVALIQKGSTQRGPIRSLHSNCPRMWCSIVAWSPSILVPYHMYSKGRVSIRGTITEVSPQKQPYHGSFQNSGGPNMDPKQQGISDRTPTTGTRSFYEEPYIPEPQVHRGSRIGPSPLGEGPSTIRYVCIYAYAILLYCLY